MNSAIPGTNYQFVAEASDYDGLKAALRARVEQLSISRSCLDEVAGLPPGYAARLLAPYSKAKIGQFSLGLILQTAGLKIVIVDDPPVVGKKGRSKGSKIDNLDGLLKAAGLKMILVEDRDALAKVQPMFDERASHQVRLDNDSRRSKGRRTPRSTEARAA